MGLTELPDGVDIGEEPEPSLSLRDRAEALRVRNEAAIAALAQQGVQLQHNIHVAVLVEHLFGGPDTTERLRYELKVQEAFATGIADVQGRAARAKLLQGVTLGANGKPGPGAG